MQMGQAGDRTADLQVGGRPLYPSATAALDHLNPWLIKMYDRLCQAERLSDHTTEMEPEDQVLLDQVASLEETSEAGALKSDILLQHVLDLPHEAESLSEINSELEMETDGYQFLSDQVASLMEESEAAALKTDMLLQEMQDLPSKAESLSEINTELEMETEENQTPLDQVGSLADELQNEQTWSQEQEDQFIDQRVKTLRYELKDCLETEGDTDHHLLVAPRQELEEQKATKD
ncbi:unnamed protein product [Pleuronectes platessa]|uniref:Uncharacterized protein n=1 Tax=Pleuronectes platessa TaxID=8262 RepID=A0A9N7ZBJ8_PLEPL|nr:unnamed protein product [Pleuronectes platessa]